jgi:hypothetical protein
MYDPRRCPAAGRSRTPSQAIRQTLMAGLTRLSGFFDVFAWRPPGEIRFMEIKVAKDKIQPTQRRFVERAFRFHDQKQFVIVEVPA